MRLDVKLHELYPSFSRAVLQKFIKAGNVSVNDRVETSTKLIVDGSDTIFIDKSVFDNKSEGSIDIPVLYEDDDCVVIDKPTGILSHSKGAFNTEPTVASWLADKTKNFGNNREGIVHRLDRATSGVMICAKSSESSAWLQKQFSQRKVKKTYIALVEGELYPAEAIIDIPIERNPKKPQQFRTGNNGKSAQTYYKVQKTLNKNGKAFSLLELMPKTGRTHQLRVHLKHLNKPIVGDNLYGGLSADRLYLHALMLEITLKNGERKIFNSTPPKSFQKPLIKQ